MSAMATVLLFVLLPLVVQTAPKHENSNISSDKANTLGEKTSKQKEENEKRFELFSPSSFIEPQELPESASNPRDEKVKLVFESVNASFAPLAPFFSHLNLKERERPAYRAGTLGSYVGAALSSLPALTPPASTLHTPLWSSLISQEEQLLGAKLARLQESGEPLYTSRRRQGGAGLAWLEQSPWLHKTLTFCTGGKPEDSQNKPKGLACSLIFDFGVDVLLMVVHLRDLVVCALVTSATGDPGVCLALLLTKLAFPGVLDNEDSLPYVGLGNVHL